MIHGLGAYAIAVFVLSAFLSVFVRNYLLSSFIASLVSPVLNLVHESWLADFDVNVGWGPPMLMMGFAIATPIALVAGLPMFAFRRWVDRRAISDSNLNLPASDRRCD